MSINEEKLKIWMEQTDRRLNQLEGKEDPKEPLLKDIQDALARVGKHLAEIAQVVVKAMDNLTPEQRAVIEFLAENPEVAEGLQELNQKLARQRAIRGGYKYSKGIEESMARTKREDAEDAPYRNAKLSNWKPEALEPTFRETIERKTPKEPIDKVKLNDLIEKIHEDEEE